MASPAGYGMDADTHGTGTVADEITSRSAALVVPRPATRNFIEQFTNSVTIGGTKKSYTKTITHAVIAIRKNILIRVCVEGNFSIGFPHCDSIDSRGFIDEKSLSDAIGRANSIEETQDQFTEPRDGRVWIHKNDYQYALQRKGDYKYNGGTLSMLTNKVTNSVYFGYLKGGTPKSSHVAIYQQWKLLDTFTEYDKKCENYIPTNNWEKQRYVNLVNLRNHALRLKKNGKCAKAIARGFETESLAREICAFFLMFDARPQTTSTDILVNSLSISPMVRSPQSSLSSSASQTPKEDNTIEPEEPEEPAEQVVHPAPLVPLFGPGLGIDVGPTYESFLEGGEIEEIGHSAYGLSDPVVFPAEVPISKNMSVLDKGKERLEEEEDFEMIESGLVVSKEKEIRIAEVHRLEADLSVCLTGAAIDCGVPLPRENSMIRQMGAVDIPENCFLRANFYPLIHISSRRYFHDKGDAKKFFSGVQDNVGGVGMEEKMEGIGGNTHYNMYATLLRDWKARLSEISMIDAVYGYSADDLCLSGLCPSIYEAMKKVCFMICGSHTVGDMQRIFPISKTFYGKIDTPTCDRICDNPRRRGRSSTKRARTSQYEDTQNILREQESGSGISYSDMAALELSELRESDRDAAKYQFSQRAMMNLEKDILEGKETLGESRKKRKKRFREGEEEDEFAIGTRDIMLVKRHFDTDEELELARQSLSDGACKGSAHISAFSVRKLDSDFMCRGLGTFRKDSPLISTSMLSITYAVKQTAQTTSIQFPKRTGRIIPIWLLPLVMSHCGFSDVLSFDAIQSFSPFSYWYSIVYRATEMMKQKISNPQTYFPGVDPRSLLPLAYYEKILCFLELTQKFKESSTSYAVDSLKRELDSIRKNQDKMMVQFRSMSQIYQEVMANYGLESHGLGNSACGDVSSHQNEDILAQVDLMVSQDIPDHSDEIEGGEQEMVGLLGGQSTSFSSDLQSVPYEEFHSQEWIGMRDCVPFTPTLS